MTYTSLLTQSHNNLIITDGILEYHPNLFTLDESDTYLDYLQKHIQWSTRMLRIHGKAIPMPRLIAWYADSAINYAYSGGTSPRQDWNPVLLEIKEKIQAAANAIFNGVLLNLYRDGNDSMGWHSDNEASLGQAPIIASLSFGACRRFQLQHKTLKKLKYNIDLEHGSLLIMRGTTQQFWRHQLAKDKNITTPRINLTFRLIKN